jgi:NodT family efflux transporter outer membrane factor (OMF) lipoprotein
MSQASRKIPGLLALLLLGCTVGPDYEKPALPSPTAWSEPGEGKVASVEADLSRWWTLFGDPGLDSLVERALHSNLDLRSAGARIREARAQYGIAWSALLPSVNATASYTRSRNSQNGLYGFGAFPRYLSEYNAGFDASWEIDLFGGARRGNEAAAADVEAAVEDRWAVMVSLLGEVARNYVALRGYQLQRAVLQENQRSAQGTVDLTRARLSAGVATALDLARAEAQYAASGALIPTVEIQLEQSIHRLGVLLGQDPSALSGELGTVGSIPAIPPRVLVGLPSTLLVRRPDVRRAERQLAAQTARIGLATAELYPRLSLTGAFGFDSIGAADFFKWGSRMWSIGPTLRWPVFAGGRIVSTIRLEEARAEQAAFAYEQAFLVALEDVENALVAYLREGHRTATLVEEVAADRRATDLANELYLKGLASFLEVLDAQRALYLAQWELAQSQAAVTLNVVALYKALGGGWEGDKSPP